MIVVRKFVYNPSDDEREKASQSYLMSLIAIIGGLPLPIVNLIATAAFWVSSRRRGLFVRYHSTQALMSQFALLLINGFAFWWTISVIFGERVVTNDYFAYIAVVLLFNLLEFVATIFTAIIARDGRHAEWWFFGAVANLIFKNELAGIDIKKGRVI